MSKLRTLILVFVSGFLLAGCYTDFGPVAAVPDPFERHVAPAGLAPGDQIKVTVYGEESLNGVYTIDPAGNVSLPLAGTVHATGRTKESLATTIAAKYKGEYLQNPKVTVELVSYRPIYVMGEVEHPGQFPYATGLDVLKAAALAGGLTYRASRDVVLIQHPGDPVWRQYSVTPMVLVAPGDLIRFPERYF